MANKSRETANLVSSKTGVAVTITGDPLILGVGNTELIRVAGAGKVGIHTEYAHTSVSKVDIYSDVVGNGGISGTLGPESANLRLIDNSAGTIDTDMGGGLIFTYRYNPTAFLNAGPYIKAVKTNNTSDDYGGGLVFGVRESGSNNQSEALRITSSGNIGISTNNPVDNLQIGGASGAAGQTPKALSIRHGTVPAYLSASFDGTRYITNLSSNIYDNSNQSQSWSSFSNPSFAAAAIQLTSDSNDSNIDFYTVTTDNTNPSHRMRINHDGKIGFGTDLTSTSGIPYTFVHPTNGSAGSVGILQVATHSNSDLYLSFGAKENVAGSGGDGSSYIRAGSGASLNNILIVETAVAGTETEQMRIDGTVSGITSVYIGKYDGSISATGFISKMHNSPWDMSICASRSSTTNRAIIFKSRLTQEVARFTDDANPYLRLSSNCAGIQFNGDTDAVDTLDYYEEGTWTPDLRFGTSNTGITYTSRAGVYTRIGNIVFCRFVFLLSNSGTATGTTRLYGLPFNVADKLSSTSLEGEGGITYFANKGSVAGIPHLFPWQNDQYAFMYSLMEGENADSIEMDESTFENNSSVRGYVWYYTA